jgi:hypothetical protein
MLLSSGVILPGDSAQIKISFNCDEVCGENTKILNVYSNKEKKYILILVDN